MEAVAVAQRAEIRERRQLVDDGDQYWLPASGFTMILTPPDSEIGKCFYFEYETDLHVCGLLAARINGDERSQLGFLLSEVAAAFLPARGLHISTSAIIEHNEDGTPFEAAGRILNLRLRLDGEPLRNFRELFRERA